MHTHTCNADNAHCKCVCVCVEEYERGEWKSREWKSIDWVSAGVRHFSLPLCVHVASRRKTIKAKPASTSTALMEALKYLARTTHKPCRCHNNITTAPTHTHACIMFVGKKESPLRTFHNKSRDTNPRNFKRCRRYSADIDVVYLYKISLWRVETKGAQPQRTQTQAAHAQLVSGAFKQTLKKCFVPVSLLF